MIDEKTLFSLWQDGAPARDAMNKRAAHYDGKQRIEELERPRIDGRRKSRVITTWVQYIVERHTGFLTAKPPTYTAPEGADADAAIKWLEAEYRAQALAEADAQHMANALLYGRGVEILVSRGGRSPQVAVTDPREWVFARDETGAVRVAVRCVVLRKGSFVGGQLLAADRFVYAVYTDTEVARFEAKSADAQPVRVKLEPHLWGRVPVVAFEARRNGESFITDALLAQCDAYDVSRSALPDDIVHNVDSLLVTKGMDYAPLLQKDENGVTVLEKLKAIGLFPLPKDADATYLTRVVDIEKFRYDHKVARAAIHLMACLPDLDETISGNEGTITNISGVALKLMFHSMLEAASEFARTFERGLRARLALFDVMAPLCGFPVVGDVQIKMHRHIPFADTELLQYLGNLAGLLSVEDRLRLLPFVDDPRATAERAKAEAPAPAPAPVAVDVPQDSPKEQM